MAVGLVDQQVNGANPRLYDFQGAFDEITAQRRRPAMSCCTSRRTSPRSSPTTLPGVTARPVGQRDPRRTSDGVGGRHRAGRRRRGHRGPPGHRAGRPRAGTPAWSTSFDRPNVRVWELPMIDDRLPRSTRRRGTAATLQPLAPGSGPRSLAVASTVAARPVLLVAAAPRPGRQPVSCSGCSSSPSCSTSCRPLGFWWTCLAGRRRHRAAPTSAPRTHGLRSSTSSSRPTASR